MKAFFKAVTLSFLAVIVMGSWTCSSAEEAPTAPAGYKLIPDDLYADFNLSVYSQYIWRGYELSKDSLVFFPQLTVGYKGFAVTTWVDLDTNYHNWAPGEREFKLQETDVIVSYSNSYAPWKLNYTLGWILYDFQPSHEVDAEVPAGAVAGDTVHTRISDTKTQELYLTLGLDTLLKPTFSVYQEIEAGQAWYFQLGASHSFNVYKDWSLDLAGYVSYMHDQSGPKDTHIGAFHDGNISAGLKIPINKYVWIKPNLQYSFPLSSSSARRIQESSMNGDNNNFVYGGLILDVAL
jgi:hypothetical protein